MVTHSSPSHTLVPALGQLDHVIGSPEHPIHVVEYGDFECPSCAQAYPSVKLLQKEFGEHICFAFRHFPVVDAHPNAELAAESAEAAAAQDKFWPMHDRLFENQAHLKPKSIRRYAAELDLDMLRYDAEIADHIYLQRIQENLSSGRASGVQGSPAFFLNGSIIDVSFGIHRLFDAITARIKHQG